MTPNSRFLLFFVFTLIFFLLAADSNNNTFVAALDKYFSCTAGTLSIDSASGVTPADDVICDATSNCNIILQSVHARSFLFRAASSPPEMLSQVSISIQDVQCATIPLNSVPEPPIACIQFKQIFDSMDFISIDNVRWSVSREYRFATTTGAFPGVALIMFEGDINEVAENITVSNCNFFVLVDGGTTFFTPYRFHLILFAKTITNVHGSINVVNNIIDGSTTLSSSAHLSAGTNSAGIRVASFFELVFVISGAIRFSHNTVLSSSGLRPWAGAAVPVQIAGFDNNVDRVLSGIFFHDNVISIPRLPSSSSGEAGFDVTGLRVRAYVAILGQNIHSTLLRLSNNFGIDRIGAPGLRFERNAITINFGNCDEAFVCTFMPRQVLNMDLAPNSDIVLINNSITVTRTAGLSSATSTLLTPPDLTAVHFLWQGSSSSGNNAYPLRGSILMTGNSVVNDGSGIDKSNFNSTSFVAVLGFQLLAAGALPTAEMPRVTIFGSVTVLSSVVALTAVQSTVSCVVQLTGLNTKPVRVFSGVTIRNSTVLVKDCETASTLVDDTSAVSVLRESVVSAGGTNVNSVFDAHGVLIVDSHVEVTSLTVRGQGHHIMVADFGRWFDFVDARGSVQVLRTNLIVRDANLAGFGPSTRIFILRIARFMYGTAAGMHVRDFSLAVERYTTLGGEVNVAALYVDAGAWISDSTQTVPLVVVETANNNNGGTATTTTVIIEASMSVANGSISLNDNSVASTTSGAAAETVTALKLADVFTFVGAIIVNNVTISGSTIVASRQTTTITRTLLSCGTAAAIRGGLIVSDSRVSVTKFGATTTTTSAHDVAVYAFAGSTTRSGTSHILIDNALAEVSQLLSGNNNAPIAVEVCLFRVPSAIVVVTDNVTIRHSRLRVANCTGASHIQAALAHVSSVVSPIFIVSNNSFEIENNHVVGNTKNSSNPSTAFSRFGFIYGEGIGSYINTSVSLQNSTMLLRNVDFIVHTPLSVRVQPMCSWYWNVTVSNVNVTLEDVRMNAVDDGNIAWELEMLPRAVGDSVKVIAARSCSSSFFGMFLRRVIARNLSVSMSRLIDASSGSSSSSASSSSSSSSAGNEIVVENMFLSIEECGSNATTAVTSTRALRLQATQLLESNLTIRNVQLRVDSSCCNVDDGGIGGGCALLDLSSASLRAMQQQPAASLTNNWISLVNNSLVLAQQPQRVNASIVFIQSLQQQQQHQAVTSSPSSSLKLMIAHSCIVAAAADEVDEFGLPSSSSSLIFSHEQMLRFAASNSQRAAPPSPLAGALVVLGSCDCIARGVPRQLELALGPHSRLVSACDTLSASAATFSLSNSSAVETAASESQTGGTNSSVPSLSHTSSQSQATQTQQQSNSREQTNHTAAAASETATRAATPTHLERPPATLSHNTSTLTRSHAGHDGDRAASALEKSRPMRSAVLAAFVGGFIGRAPFAYTASLAVSRMQSLGDCPSADVDEIEPLEFDSNLLQLSIGNDALATYRGAVVGAFILLASIFTAGGIVILLFANVYRGKRKHMKSKDFSRALTSLRLPGFFVIPIQTVAPPAASGFAALLFVGSLVAKNTAKERGGVSNSSSSSSSSTTALAATGVVFLAALPAVWIWWVLFRRAAKEELVLNDENSSTETTTRRNNNDSQSDDNNSDDDQEEQQHQQQQQSDHSLVRLMIRNDDDENNQDDSESSRGAQREQQEEDKNNNETSNSWLLALKKLVEWLTFQKYDWSDSRVKRRFGMVFDANALPAFVLADFVLQLCIGSASGILLTCQSSACCNGSVGALVAFGVIHFGFFVFVPHLFLARFEKYFNSTLSFLFLLISLLSLIGEVGGIVASLESAIAGFSWLFLAVSLTYCFISFCINTIPGIPKHWARLREWFVKRRAKQQQQQRAKKQSKKDKTPRSGGRRSSNSSNRSSASAAAAATAAVNARRRSSVSTTTSGAAAAAAASATASATAPQQHHNHNQSRRRSNASNSNSSKPVVDEADIGVPLVTIFGPSASAAGIVSPLVSPLKKSNRNFRPFLRGTSSPPSPPLLVMSGTASQRRKAKSSKKAASSSPPSSMRRLKLDDDDDDNNDATEQNDDRGRNAVKDNELEEGLTPFTPRELECRKKGNKKSTPSAAAAAHGSEEQH